jgi:hypothetical protein
VCVLYAKIWTGNIIRIVYVPTVEKRGETIMVFVYAPAVAIREGDIITIASAPSAKRWDNPNRMSS